ncbi:MAG TPA: anthranilate synthase component I family protein [Bacteroidia bacterium]|jgi:para-aminobenzoate synthetase component 1|nr:anthranilate synthase component I family protein [Bacteroidia bacterium]
MSFAADLKNTKYFALFNNNSNSSGFEDCFLFGFLPSQSQGNMNGFFFCNYDHKNKIEDLTSKKISPLKFEDLIFFESEKKLSLNEFNSLYVTLGNTSCAINLNSKTTKADYIKNVSELKKHIQHGDIYEINYCITFEAENVKIDPIAVYQKLNSISKAPYSALIKLDDKYIISASPELFLSKRGNKLITKPIKGTAKRGLTTEEDSKLKNELLNSLKERTENVMIVDVSRNDLSRIAKKGTVIVEKLYDIETYEQVHQMVSTVSCELKENISFNDIIRATFPMASMTGAPKIRAMELIDDFETNSRGPYSGCMGYIKENGDFDLSVLIRSIFYNESESYLSFSVGSAITALCDPEKEYEECLLKAVAMKKVLEVNY